MKEELKINTLESSKNQKSWYKTLQRASFHKTLLLKRAMYMTPWRESFCKTLYLQKDYPRESCNTTSQEREFIQYRRLLKSRLLHNSQERESFHNVGFSKIELLLKSYERESNQYRSLL